MIRSSPVCPRNKDIKLKRCIISLMVSGSLLTTLWLHVNFESLDYGFDSVDRNQSTCTAATKQCQWHSIQSCWYIPYLGANRS
jgi:hypothetical protein